jgi:hypothetical protein
MEKLPLSELLALPRRLSVFTAPIRLPLAALERGLCPPLLVSKSSLIWGQRSLDELARLAPIREREPKKDVVAPILLTVEKLDLEAREEILAVLIREARTGLYSPAEEWAIAREARSIAPSDAEFHKSVSLLVRGDANLFALLDRLEALPPSRRGLVESDAIDLKTAERARSLPEEAAAAFAELAPKLSASERRIALGYLDDIATNSRGAASSHDTAGLVALMKSAAAEAEPIATLRGARYPELASMEADFARITERELGGSGVKLEAPPTFEGQGFTLSFEFSSAAALEKRLAAAGRLKGACDELFAFLR